MAVAEHWQMQCELEGIVFAILELEELMQKDVPCSFQALLSQKHFAASQDYR